VLSEFGKVDILINCAGTTKKGPTLTFSEEDWDNILETNLTGTLRGCQVFGEPMLAAGMGGLSILLRFRPLWRSMKWRRMRRARRRWLR
jgi:NAD(P)-dependent dehydrogenase (short-subunit alcohol dehydrogenase family)